MNRRVNLDRPVIPDPQVTRWLEANEVDPREVWASQKVLVTDTLLVYIGWPPGPKVLSDTGTGWYKQAYAVPLIQPPESFGLVAEPEPITQPDSNRPGSSSTSNS